MIIDGALLPTISVIVCTHLPERIPFLGECLASLSSQLYKPDEVIIVVDGDPELAEIVRRDQSGVEVSLLPQRSGVSAARNHGAQLAHSDVIAFLDDDAIAEPDWLSALGSALQDPAVLGASGLSVPLWQTTKTSYRWIPEEFYWVIGCSYRGQPKQRAIVRNVFGGCAAFRRNEFLELGGFNPAIGRHGANLAGGEEADLSLRATVRWPERYFIVEPSAIIQHRVTDSRVTLRYFARRAFVEGRSKAGLLMPSFRSSSANSRTEVFFAMAIPSAAIRLLLAGFRGEPSSFPRLAGLALGAVASACGILVGLLSRRTTPPAEVPPLQP